MHIFYLPLFVILSLLNSGTVCAETMSVSQAYRVLQHQQTQFDSDKAHMSAEESRYLEHLFFVTDLSFRERMVMLQYFNAGTNQKYIDTYNKEIANLLGSFMLVEPPNNALKEVEALVIGAIDGQREFFNIWHRLHGTKQYIYLQSNMASHKYVQSSHRKLLQAYTVLKEHYPNEISHNQTSFYDHLCALDFL